MPFCVSSVNAAPGVLFAQQAIVGNVSVFPNYDTMLDIFSLTPLQENDRLNAFMEHLKENISATPTVKSIHVLPSLRRFLWTALRDEPSILMRQSLRKDSGYVHRLFTGESWIEWADNRTALGRVMAAFIYYLEDENSLGALRNLTANLLQEANVQAKQALMAQESPTSYNTESVWQTAAKLFQHFEARITLLLSFPPGAEALETAEIVDTDDQFIREQLSKQSEPTSTSEGGAASTEIVVKRFKPWLPIPIKPLLPIKRLGSIKPVDPSFVPNSLGYPCPEVHRAVESILAQLKTQNTAGIQEGYVALIEVMTGNSLDAKTCSIQLRDFIDRLSQFDWETVSQLVIRPLPNLMKSILLGAQHFPTDMRKELALPMYGISKQLLVSLPPQDEAIYEGVGILLKLANDTFPYSERHVLPVIKLGLDLASKQRFFNDTQKKQFFSLAEQQRLLTQHTQSQEHAEMLWAALWCDIIPISNEWLCWVSKYAEAIRRDVNLIMTQNTPDVITAVLCVFLCMLITAPFTVPGLSAAGVGLMTAVVRLMAARINQMTATIVAATPEIEASKQKQVALANGVMGAATMSSAVAQTVVGVAAVTAGAVAQTAISATSMMATALASRPNVHHHETYDYHSEDNRSIQIGADEARLRLTQ